MADSAQSNSQQHRVVLWGTGAIGSELLTAILDHRPDLQIAGARVYAPEKNGADIATFLDRSPIGVTATTDVEEILALDADCVLYTPRNTSIDEVCAILESGKNVVTTAFLFHPLRIDADDRDRLLAACQAGRTSVHGSGLNPGNLSGVLPLALSGMSRRIDRITLQERADWSFYDSTAITFDNMAFGQPVEDINPTANDFLAFNSGIFSNEVWLMADALNAGIDEVTATVEAVPAFADHQIFDHLLRAGTTAGHPSHWPKPQHGWTLTIDGDPTMRTHFLVMAGSPGASMLEHVTASNVATAMQILNAVPAVCAAPPGFATMADLPLIRSVTGFGND
jgi:hypothetical protein